MRTQLALPTLLGLALALGGTAAAPLRADSSTVLERYVLGVGDRLAGTRTVLLDEHLGNGTAKTRLVLGGGTHRGALELAVSRRVRAGEITFALLVFGVELRGRDASGAEVWSVDLPGFSFGDSRGGAWRRRLVDVPVEVAELEVRFLGNYE